MPQPNVPLGIKINNTEPLPLRNVAISIYIIP